jgi:thymidylate synthase ThyX
MQAKATYIPVARPKSLPSNCPEGLEPEVLAACLARYSRSNEGIETIISKYGGKSPEAIFKFVDYGHASIAGLTGAIAIAIDNISMLAALKLFELAQMADGQESSTRYITLNPEADGVLQAQDIGLKPAEEAIYLECITQAARLYSKASKGLEDKVSQDPSIARIPKEVSEKAAERMLKNYALDRCRYFLSTSSKTNVALVMSARMWAETLKGLDSLPWLETKTLTELIRKELQKVAPNLIRHSYADQASMAQTTILLDIWQKETQRLAQNESIDLTKTKECQLELQAWQPNAPSWESIDKETGLCLSFKGKTNRYSMTGPWLKRVCVCCQWSAMTLAEIRDLNRHRTGFRQTALIPQGFYLPQETKDTILELGMENDLKEFFKNYKTLLTSLAQDKTYPYGLFLGSQLPFEHTQQADKFVYEAELRTGIGAHFKYAEHLKQAAEAFCKIIPCVRPYIEIGTAEPE